MSQLKYVEMICKLDQLQPEHNPLVERITCASTEHLDPETLFECYLKSFRTGDAQFFKHQDADEQARYFQEELGFPEVLTNPASFVYKFEDEIIGFALVMAYLEKNYHISCMCVLPEYRNQGLGKAMLTRIKNIAIENGCRSLTLGTETDMKAFHLYGKNGFRVIAEHVVEL
jgi:ribosomal protein S18 acetylase RimI-like enzyme